MEILDELVFRAHFRGISYFVDLESRNFEGLFEGVDDFFGIKGYDESYYPLGAILHSNIFPMVIRSPESQFI